jgi:hypothetical protein
MTGKTVLVAEFGDADGLNGLAHAASAMELASGDYFCLRTSTAGSLSNLAHHSACVRCSRRLFLSPQRGKSRDATCRGNISFHRDVRFADFHSAYGILCGTESLPVEASRVLCPCCFSLGNLPSSWSSSILESAKPNAHLRVKAVPRFAIHFVIAYGPPPRKERGLLMRHG